MSAARPTLRNHMQRIAYVVVNVVDLEKSRAFYEEIAQMRPLITYEAPAQPFRGLGLESGEFRALAMVDDFGTGASELHLVQWTQPATHGEAYPVFWHVGLAKVAFIQPDIERTFAALEEHGIRPTNQYIQRNYISVLDPDGCTVALPHPTRPDPAKPIRPHFVHVNPSITDVDEAWRFYGEFLGLDIDFEHRPKDVMATSQGPGSDRSRWDSHMLTVRGDKRLHIDYSQFRFPEPTPETSTPYPSATNRGIARVGFEVDDLDACYAIAREAIAAGATFTVVAEPEAWDLGAYGTKRTLCLLDPDGIRIELVEEKRKQPRTDFDDVLAPSPRKAW